MSQPIYRYGLDPTGVNRDNLITREPHQLVPKPRVTDVRVVAPLYGPFYAESLVIVDTNTNRVLDKGIDYVTSDILQDPSLKFAKDIKQFIVIKNGTVSNDIEITYQTLGGNYQNDATAVQLVYETFLNDARAVDWEDINGKPEGFPPSPHIHLLTDVIGWGPMLYALQRVRDAILISNSSTFENFIEWFKVRPVDWNLVINRPTTLAGYGITDAVNISRRIRTIDGIQGGGNLAQDLTLSLTQTGVAAGVYGKNSYFPTIAVDDRGRITTAGEIEMTFSMITKLPTTLAGYGITDAVDTFSNQVAGGQKVWTAQMIQESVSSTTTNGYRISDRIYGAFWRMEAGKLMLMLTNKDDARGNPNTLRPFTVDMVTGEVTIGKLIVPGGMDGNASTATKLQTPRTIGLSGGATGTPTAFDGSANIVIPITGLDMDRATAGTLSGSRGGTGIGQFTAGQYFIAETQFKMKMISAEDMMRDLGKSVKIIAGNGLSGGGPLSADVTVTMATPGTLSGTTTNAVTAAGHTHAINEATTTVAGIVKRATDSEVQLFSGTGVISPPQLAKLASTMVPEPVSTYPRLGTSNLYARQDHVHNVNRMTLASYQKLIVNQGPTVMALTKSDMGSFGAITVNRGGFSLPSPSLFSVSEDVGLTFNAWVLGYDTYGTITMPGSWGDGSTLTLNFYSTITAILGLHPSGQLRWFLTDDGHTIFSGAPGGDTTYKHAWTRLGNPGDSSSLGGVYYMESFRVQGLIPGIAAVGTFRRNYGNTAVKVFASIRANVANASVRVTQLTNSNVSVVVDSPSGGFDFSVDILVFGSYSYGQI